MRRDGRTRRQFLAGLAAGTAVTAGAGLAVGRTSAQAAASEVGWPMFGQNPTNTGETGSSGPRDGVAVGWESDLVAATPPAVLDGRVYVGTDDGIVALEAASGEEDWRVSTDSAVTTCPAVAEEIVYAGTDGGRVHARSATDGSDQWTYDAGAPIVSAPVVQTLRDFLFVADSSGGVYQLDSLAGHEEWSQNLDSEITGSLAASNENTTIYVPGSGAVIYGLDLRVGDVRWSNNYNTDTLATPMVVGTLGYVGDNQGTLYEFSGYGGKNWERDLTGSIRSVPAFSNDVIYAATDEGHVYAFEINGDVTERWQAELDGSVTTAPAVSRGSGTVYVGDETGTVTAFDVSSGNERWSARLSIGTPHLAVSNGAVFAAGDGVVRLEDGSETRIAMETPTPTPTPEPAETATTTGTAEPVDTPTATPTPPPESDATPTVAPTATPTQTVAAGGNDGGDEDGDGAGTTASGSGTLAPWVTLAAIGGLGALGMRGDDGPTGGE